jgi:hypothetical protein
VHGVVGGHSLVRVGSFLADPLGLGFFLVVPVALAVARFALGTTTAWSAGLVAGAGLVTLVFTQTRSALLGALLGTVLLFAVAVKRSSPGAVRMGLSVSAAAVVVAVFAAGTTFTERLSSSFNNANSDTHDHTSRSLQGLKDVFSRPFGLGLGSNQAVGIRFQTSTATITEDAYLQVGTELGVAAMLLFFFWLLSVLFRMGAIVRAARPETVPYFSCGVWAGGWGLLIVGFFLHVWLAFATCLPFAVLAGMVLTKVADDRPVEPPGDELVPGGDVLEPVPAR